MPGEDHAGDGDPGGGDAALGDAHWRERAVERSLRTARDRALSRSDRFMAAATELMLETDRTDFTVQQIVERSKMSLRSFYQHFASKDELLLALLEEGIRGAIDRLRVQVACDDDPAERLRTFIVGLSRLTEEGTGSTTNRAFTVYHLRLAESHPTEFAHAIAPQVDLLLEILEDGVATGQFRSDLPAAHLATIVTQALVSSMHMNVLGVQLADARVTGDNLFSFCLGGVSPPAAAVPAAADHPPRAASGR
jgi:AcrR family transcriptional regulator